MQICFIQKRAKERKCTRLILPHVSPRSSACGLAKWMSRVLYFRAFEYQYSQCIPSLPILPPFSPPPPHTHRVVDGLSSLELKNVINSIKVKEKQFSKLAIRQVIIGLFCTRYSQSEN